MNIFKLIKNNIENILDNIEDNDNIKDFIYKFNEKEYIKLIFKGRGAYGLIFQIINYTNCIKDIPKNDSLILKVIKVKCEEMEKCKQLKKKMDNVKKNSLKNILVNKYCTKIINIKTINNLDLIFFEYIDGYDLKDYIINNNLSENDLNIIYLKCLISIKVFHKILDYSHRDIKLKNFIYDKKNNNIKIIDYGFICNRKDKKCYNKYQGTAHYIHPYMNKKFSNIGLSKKNNINNNNKNISFSNNNIKSKKIYKYPNSISQDLFSSLIIFIKLVYIYNHKNNINNNLQQYIKIFNESSKREMRFMNKKNLIKNLININTNYNNSIINLILGVFKNFWDMKKNDFNINKITNENISEYIYDSLIYSLIILTDDYKNKHYLINEWRNIIKL